MIYWPRHQPYFSYANLAIKKPLRNSNTNMDATICSGSVRKLSTLLAAMFQLSFVLIGNEGGQLRNPTFSWAAVQSWRAAQVYPTRLTLHSTGKSRRGRRSYVFKLVGRPSDYHRLNADLLGPEKDTLTVGSAGTDDRYPGGPRNIRTHDFGVSGLSIPFLVNKNIM